MHEMRTSREYVRSTVMAGYRSRTWIPRGRRRRAAGKACCEELDQITRGQPLDILERVEYGESFHLDFLREDEL